MEMSKRWKPPSGRGGGVVLKYNIEQLRFHIIALQWHNIAV